MSISRPACNFSKANYRALVKATALLHSLRTSTRRLTRLLASVLPLHPSGVLRLRQGDRRHSLLLRPVRLLAGTAASTNFRLRDRPPVQTDLIPAMDLALVLFSSLAHVKSQEEDCLTVRVPRQACVRRNPLLGVQESIRRGMLFPSSLMLLRHLMSVPLAALASLLLHVEACPLALLQQVPALLMVALLPLALCLLTTDLSHHQLRFDPFVRSEPPRLDLLTRTKIIITDLASRFRAQAARVLQAVHLHQHLLYPLLKLRLVNVKIALLRL